MIEIKRVLERFDSLMGKKDFDGAERLLTYWIGECEEVGDLRNRFTLLNELTGFYRMRNERAKGIKVCKTLLETVDKMKLADKVSGATAFVNVATAYKNYGYVEKAIPLYESAKEIYERELEQNDDRLPALYNNMALSLAEAGNKENIIKAQEYFEKALKLLQNLEASENEQAVTYLNMSDLEYYKFGPVDSESVIEDYVNTAYKLLEKSYLDNNPDFRMTAEKCIPVIRHYGFFMMANSLQEKIQ